ncbi:MAG: Lipid A biosynthesis acyltransferase [candidate division Zixibacteria bacterium RBG-1]|nr:MAG: Lipid A biosynthesis acyltransferase [candidate division Zixibacteria bacterium RBG-1]OGC83894.1 MAG: hypothetical protein A2V73_08560 [candidate division Zixibacteria bacterium RBG_19FT_COMBO_42_43]
MGKRRSGNSPQRFRHLLEYWLLLTIGAILRLLPYRINLKIANFLGKVGFGLLRIRRKVTLANLRMVFGNQKTENEIEKIALGSYCHMARGFIEHLIFPALSKEKILSNLEFENLHYLDEIMQHGKGAILVSSHFGSWQIGGTSVRLAGYPMNFLVQRQNNHLAENLVYSYVEDKGVTVLYKSVSAGKILALLNSNQIVAVLPDQDAGKNGVIVNFMGQPASTHKGPAFFSLKTGAPIVIALSLNQQNGKHKVVIEKPIYLHETGNRDEDIKNLTQVYTSKIEEYIRKYPDHWFWQHRRWKSTLNIY